MRRRKHKEAGEFLSVACESARGGGKTPKTGVRCPGGRVVILLENSKKRCLEIGSFVMTNLY